MYPVKLIVFTLQITVHTAQFSLYTEITECQASAADMQFVTDVCSADVKFSGLQFFLLLSTVKQKCSYNNNNNILIIIIIIIKIILIH